MNKFVISHYDSPWIGIVLDYKKRTNNKSFLLVLVLKDKNCNLPRKRILKILDESWTREIPPFDISHVNKDWFTNLDGIKRAYQF